MTAPSEASLRRVWQHNQDPNSTFAILCAFDDQCAYQENLRRNTAMAADVRAQGYGFFYLDGHWIENAGTANQHEHTVFVVTTTGQGFSENILKLLKRYDPAAAVVKHNLEAQLIFSDGTAHCLAQLTPGQLGTVYSSLRGRPDQQFVFDAERDDLSWIQRLAHYNFKRNAGS